MADGERVPPGLDVTKPSIARVYDAFLGGKDNFAADRAVVDLTLQIAPDAATGARANRAFLRRAVRYLVEQAGLRQLIDIGSGLPTQGNVHEVAEELDPATQVLYVDNDPMVRVHAQALLACSPQTVFATADIREPDKILGHPKGGRVPRLRPSPSACCCWPSCTTSTTTRTRPGSWPGCASRCLAAATSSSPVSACRGRSTPRTRPRPRRSRRRSTRSWAPAGGAPTRRSWAWFGDWELVEPGLVPLPEWRPDGQPPEVRDSTYHGFVGAVARKP